MGRKRRGTPIHGWLVIDKPKGLTSNAVVGRVKRITNAARSAARRVGKECRSRWSP